MLRGRRRGRAEGGRGDAPAPGRGAGVASSDAAASVGPAIPAPLDVPVAPGLPGLTLPPPTNAKEHMARDGRLPAPDSPEILALRRLPLVGATRALLFYQVGARSLEDIAAIDETAFRRDPRVRAYPDGSVVDAFPLIQGYARALAAGRPIMVAEEPLFRRLRGPFVYFDLEFVAGNGEIFLWGFKHEDERRVVQWWGHTHEAQRRSMLDFKQLVFDEDPLFVAYGSTASDEVAIREAARRFGLEGGWLRDMRFLDLLQRVVFTESPETQRVYLPVRNLKCDAVAEFFGYRMPKDVDVKDGYHAFKLYQRYRRRPEPSIAARLMRYNEEDLHQTEVIFRGLERLFGELGQAPVSAG